jgi:hypothetical protein
VPKSYSNTIEVKAGMKKIVDIFTVMDTIATHIQPAGPKPNGTVSSNVTMDLLQLLVIVHLVRMVLAPHGNQIHSLSVHLNQYAMFQ